MSKFESRRDRRESIGIARAYLASEIGVSEQTLFNWETGKRQPANQLLDRRWESVLRRLERREVRL